MNEIGLGKLLQRARKRAGLTQQELCQQAGLSYSTLAKIERGAIKAPSIFTIQSVVGALGTTLDGLMGGLPSVGQNGLQTPRKRSKSGISFVYFDVNGCLVRFYHRAFTRIAEDSGRSADVVESAFWHLNDAVCRGDLSMAEFNRDLGKKFELPGFDWSSYYLTAVEPIPQMHELAVWASEHYQIGLLTNITPGLVDTMLERGLLPKAPYAVIIDSSIVHAIKPEPTIYEIAQARSGVQATEILLVDDSRPNIMAAEKLGWKVLWFDDYRPEESVARVRDALRF
jgi:FMN phosphatase YigB (HAD superfamily)/DNA-binding XRE family transcriptional regulator